MYSIELDGRFITELNEILNFIGEDNPSAAARFERDIYAKIDTLAFSPFRCRAHSSEDTNLRDLIFKGYIIVFLVENTHIEILGIYRANKWQS